MSDDQIALKQKFSPYFIEIKMQNILPGTFIVFNIFLY